MSFYGNNNNNKKSQKDLSYDSLKRLGSVLGEITEKVGALAALSCIRHVVLGRLWRSARID